jgi:hypothetical protein
MRAERLLKDTIDTLRYTLASPFSPSYAAKKRWLRERSEWESRGIAQTEMRKKVYVVSRTGAVCITVSKCANTTMKFMLHPEGTNTPRRVHGDDYLLTRLTDTGRTLNDLLDGSARIFTFARHPVSRFWSAYFTKIFRRPHSEVASEISACLHLPQDAEISPEAALDYIRAVSPVVMDEHICPQWACTGIEKLPINFVGRVETMPGDIEKLLEMGYLEAGHARRYRHLDQSASREINDKGRIDRIIRDVYAKDMELFGYD